MAKNSTANEQTLKKKTVDRLKVMKNQA